MALTYEEPKSDDSDDHHFSALALLTGIADYFEIKDESIVGEWITTNTLPSEYDLQFFPNPYSYNSLANIQFTTPYRSQIRVKLYDLLGQEITGISSVVFEPGSHRFGFKMPELTSGVYFLSVSGSTHCTIPITIVH